LGWLALMVGLQFRKSCAHRFLDETEPLAYWQVPASQVWVAVQQ
jgi:hypothetical protein